MGHEREDAMDGMMNNIGNCIPSSLNIIQQNSKLELPIRSNFGGSMLENEHNMFDIGMLSNGGGLNASSMSHLACSSNLKPELPLVNSVSTVSNTNLSPKRLPPGLYWTGQDDYDQAGTSKRLQLDNNNSTDHVGGVRNINDETNGGNNSNSIITLLSQIPQTPSIHQQAMLGTSSDGLFRSPYSLPGMNWYS